MCEVWFYFSNGHFIAKFGNKEFTSTVRYKDGNNSQRINVGTLDYITSELRDCQSASVGTWTKYGNRIESGHQWEPMNWYLFD